MYRLSGSGAHSQPIDNRTVADRSIDEYRPLRIAIIGSGISGIIASIRLRQRIANLELTVYEKNGDIGGTWLENRYPGCACDIPAHTYQATFEPNKEWTTFYATAPEIHAYWKRVAHRYGCMKYVKLEQQVVEAVWDGEESRWHLQIKDLANGSVYSDECNILISATGALNAWKWPDIPGLADFQGMLMHSARWDEGYDYTGKRVAVIGNGSSGIQIVPGMLPKVAHLDHYIRSRTWIAPTFARDEVDKRGTELGNCVERELQSVHNMTRLGTPEQIEAQDVCAKSMRKRLSPKPELFNQLLPSFPPFCRRITPGPGYLEALTDERVDVITSDIVKVKTDGIVTADGAHRPTDVLVCATGFDTTFAPRFPVLGRGGLSLSERWEKTPETYLSLAVDEFPNYFICFGPNSALGEGNLLVVIEKLIDYITACAEKMQRDNIRTMTPRKEAVERFTRYCDQHFSRTTFGQGCRSWYKGRTEEGRVTGLWPGSSLHAMTVLGHPRWEDYALNEKHKAIDVAYLDDGQIDFPPAVVEG